MRAREDQDAPGVIEGNFTLYDNEMHCNTGILIYVLLYSGKDFWGANATYAL